MRVLLGRGEALDFDARAADRLGERLQVRRGGDDAELLLCEDVSRRRREDERQESVKKPPPPPYGEEGSNYERLVKIDFGIMQCTPLRTSTTCETRQSAAIDTRLYAS